MCDACVTLVYIVFVYDRFRQVWARSAATSRLENAPLLTSQVGVSPWTCDGQVSGGGYGPTGVGLLGWTDLSQHTAGGTRPSVMSEAAHFPNVS